MKFQELPEEILLEEEVEISNENLSVQDIKRTIDELPLGYRLVFTLYMFEEMTHKEIADHLGISESTSKSQLNRAKKKLRDIINSREHGRSR